MVIISTVFIIPLGRTVLADLRSLANARSDDISWNVAQVEIELLRMQSAAYAVSQTTEGDLAAFRQRFDIFYSRLSTLSQGAFFRSLPQDSRTRVLFAAAQDFLDRTTPLVDGSENSLISALPGIIADSAAFYPDLRELALLSLEHSVDQASLRRDKLATTLMQLAAAGIALVLILFVSVFALLRLFQTRERISQENQQTRSRFEAMVGSSLDAVLVVDVAGKIIEFNGSAETVFGYTRDEALGQDMAALIVPEHLREMHQKGMRRYLETGDTRVIGAGRVRLEALRKSGEIFPVELSISLAEAGGERVFVSFLRDITSELKAEEDLRDARDRALEGERAKSNLLTVMSHEMRTPLNGILGSLELMKREEMSPQQKRYLNSVEVSGELLLSHVSDVLALSGLSAGNALPEPTAFNLRDLVQNVTDSLLASAVTRGNSLQLNFLCPDPCVVLGHRTALQQCLVNLIGNAIKFTRDGTIAIEVEQLSGSNLFQIRVSDEGIGISEENLPRVFEEFVTVDASYSRENTGTGLGLAITRGLVEKMGGQITAESVPGEGSMFVIELPLPVAPWQSEFESPEGDDPACFVGNGHRILVVDDNEINRMILVDMLSDMQFEVVEAVDGYDAIHQLSEASADLILLDISMPGIDGLETLSQIRALDVPWCQVPTIAVTAHAAPEDHARIMQEDFSDLLTKPVQVSDLVQRLTEVLLIPLDSAADQTPDAPAEDFIRRFGAEKYHKALADLRVACSELAKDIGAEPGDLSDVHDTAHKLAGSAAILGQDELRVLLLKVEVCETISVLRNLAQVLHRSIVLHDVRRS